MAAAGACGLWSSISARPVATEHHEEMTNHGAEHAWAREHLKNTFGIFVGVTP
jgi:hypothetical protein